MAALHKTDIRHLQIAAGYEGGLRGSFYGRAFEL